METKEKKEENYSLQDFAGFEVGNAETVDFFGEKKIPDIKTEEVKKPNEKEDKKVEEKETKEEVKKEEEKTKKKETFFDTEEEDGEEGKGNSKKEDEPKTNFAETLKFLKGKKFLDYKLEEGKELTDEIAEELFEEEFDNAVESRIEELFSGLSQTTKDLVKFEHNGGDINKFFQMKMAPSKTGLKRGMDIEDEKVQETVFKALRKEEGFEDEDIETEIEFLKDSGKLERMVKSRYKKWEEQNLENEKALLKEQEKARAEAKKKQREYKNNINKFLKETDSVKGIKLSRKDKSELPVYITNADIELEDGRLITGMQKDLFEALQDSEKMVFLARLLKNEFNLQDLVDSIETAVTKKVKENISKHENDSIKDTGSGVKRQGAKKNVWDYLD